MFQAQLDYDSIDSENRAINFASVRTSIGLGDNLGGNGESRAEGQIIPASRRNPAGKVGSNDFWKVNGNYSRLQTLTDTQTLLVRIEGQHSPSLLTSTEQYTIGGPNNVRAYPMSEHLVDSAAFASLEWTVNAPAVLGFGDVVGFGDRTWGEKVRVSLFGDWAWGQINDPTAADEASANFLGIGAGVQYTEPGEFTARVQVAQQVGSGIKNALNPSGDPSDGDTVRWWFDFTYTF